MLGTLSLQPHASVRHTQASHTHFSSCHSTTCKGAPQLEVQGLGPTLLMSGWTGQVEAHTCGLIKDFPRSESVWICYRPGTEIAQFK